MTHEWTYRTIGLLGTDHYVGPVSEPEMLDLAEEGKLTLNSLVSSPTYTQDKWFLLSQIPALAKACEDGVRRRNEQAKEKERQLEGMMQSVSPPPPRPGKTALDSSTDVGNPTQQFNFAAWIGGGLIFVLLPVVAGGALIYFCAQIPCVGFLGVILGLGLIFFALMIAGLAVGVVKPEDLPQKPEPTRNPTMICPHCQAKGTVVTERVKMKKGVSGAKLTAAVLTGGVSIIATGLSRKEDLTKAHCTSCGNTWHF